MALSKYLLPAPFVSRRVLLPAFSSLQRLPTEDLFNRRPTEDLFHKLWNRSPMFPHNSNTPMYHVDADDKKYAISIDLPGVKANEMKLKLLPDNVLHLSGGRKFQDEGRTEESKFSYHFSLANKNLDVENLHAHLRDGVLEIGVPRIETAEAEQSKEIHISEGNSLDPDVRMTDDLED